MLLYSVKMDGFVNTLICSIFTFRQFLVHIYLCVEGQCLPETSHSTEGHSQSKQDGLKVEKPQKKIAEQVKNVTKISMMVMIEISKIKTIYI